MSQPHFDVTPSQRDLRCEGENERISSAQKLAKGTMHLIDAERAEALYAAMGPAIEASGGSAGNTAAGVASLGGRAAFIGKVADDALGQFYRHDMRAAGVHFETPPLKGGVHTARFVHLITPGRRGR